MLLLTFCLPNPHPTNPRISPVGNLAAVRNHASVIFKNKISENQPNPRYPCSIIDKPKPKTLNPSWLVQHTRDAVAEVLLLWI